MKTRQISFSALLTIGICAIGAPQARALDTDVYTKSQSLQTNNAPNVMIILDTSGSMDTVIQNPPQYSNAIDYCSADLNALYPTILDPNSGKPSNCAAAADRVYWSDNNSSAPSITSNRWFDAPASNRTQKNKCLASINPLYNSPTNGVYAGDRIVRWKNGWGPFSTSETNTDITFVDCQADDPSNGLTTGDNNRPKNATSLPAYTTSSSQAIGWGGRPRFKLYSGNYMNYISNAALQDSVTRIEAAQFAVNQIIDANPSIRFGLMVFNRNDTTAHSGGRVIFKIDTMDAARRTTMHSVVDSTVANGNTPLAETLWEAYRYFSGQTVDFGDNDTGVTPLRDLTAEVGGTASTGGTYISPFQFSCQKAYIVYVTDGDPTSDSDANTKIQTLIGHNCDAANGVSSCLDDLAGWMHTNDANSTLPDPQTVNTFTVGFGGGISASGRQLLIDTAAKGGGEYVDASNSTDLVNALQSAIAKALEANTSFQVPSLSVNAFNRLFNREDLFMALFKPQASCAWPGNVKKYKLCTQADISASRCSKLSDVLDADLIKATDPTTHKIVSTARSFWSAADDGPAVELGGARENMPSPATRKLYTFFGSYTGLSDQTPGALIEINKTSPANAFYSAVTTTPTLLGLPATSTTAEVDDLIYWMRGEDIYNQPPPVTSPRTPAPARPAFGDVLHSRPVAVGYGGTDASPIIKLFFGTNDGAIHMLRADTGVEQWAFMPQEMYGMQTKLSKDADDNHLIGIDNTPTFWIIDKNKNGVIEPADDKIFMFVSTRRGGRNIYAFDVTPTATMTSNADSVTPKLIWVIQGGTGDFTQLSQTWSRPLVTRVRVKCASASCNDGNASTPDSEPRVVLMFGGGYDPNQDTTIPTTTDSVGNAIYMVDPLKGTRLWWASSDATAMLQLPKMNYGIASDLALIDTDGDGATDRVYVGDTGGQLWRIDLNNQLVPGSNNGGTTGYVFADVGCFGGTRASNGSCTGTVAQHKRKLLYPPDVAPVKDTVYSTNPFYDMVTIGSGDREDPLDFLTTDLTSPPDSREAVHNRLFAFRDYNYVTGSPTVLPTTPLSEGGTGANGLYDASANLLSTSTGAALTAEMNTLRSKSGWFIDLKATGATTLQNGVNSNWWGEKVLAKTTVIDGVLFATSFRPTNNSDIAAQLTSVCDPNEGIATEYGLDMLTAVGAVDFDNNGTKERSAIIGGGIPSEVVPVYLPDGGTSLVQAGGGLYDAKTSNSSTVRRNTWQGCNSAPGSGNLCGE